MNDGMWGRVLRVNLDEMDVKTEEVDSSVYKKFLGGVGFGTKILYEEVGANVDPLGSENKIIFAVGPFQATRLAGSGRWSVVSKSPLTETYGEASGGANWGPMLKKAGYDALIIEGRAERPVFLWIHEGKAEVYDAENIWGQDAIETVAAVKGKIEQPKASVVTIGQAGERMVRIAGIVADGHGFAARCGLGAVMGSKNLKAIAVYGSKTPALSDPVAVNELTRRMSANFAREGKELREHGTASALEMYYSYGDTPIKYWRGDVWEEVRKLTPPEYTEVLKARPNPCLYCSVGCHRQITVSDPMQYKMEGAGPEYETLAMLGTNLLNSNLKALAKANDLCNRLGIDTISAGAMIGFAMECFDRGLLTEKDTGGITLKWGDEDTIIELIKQIGMREKFGAIFSEGTLKAAEKIGKGAEEIVVHVRGLDFPAHDPRTCFSLAVNYATSPRGACHMRGNTGDVETAGLLLPEIGISESPEFFEKEGKAKLAKTMQDLACVANSLTFCHFAIGTGVSLTDISEYLSAVTGWGYSINDIMLVGERIFNLQRVINIRDGRGASYDRLPKRMFEPGVEGFRKYRVPPFEEMLKEYYDIRGWSSDGAPTEEKLSELGLAL